MAIVYSNVRIYTNYWIFDIYRCCFAQKILALVYLQIIFYTVSIGVCIIADTCDTIITKICKRQNMFNHIKLVSSFKSLCNTSKYFICFILDIIKKKYIYISYIRHEDFLLLLRLARTTPPENLKRAGLKSCGRIASS